MTAHAGVVVEDNTFVVGDVTLLQAKSVAGLDVRGNTVVRDDAARSLALTVRAVPRPSSRSVRDATPPVASGAVATATPGAVEATWSYADADGDAQDGSVVRWYVAAGDAWEPFATGARVDVPAAVTGRAVRAVVVPRDASGSLGAPVASAPVAAVGAPVADDDASLSTLALGNAVPVAEGTWAVGPSATAVAVHAAATHPDAEVAVLGGEPLPGGGAVVPLAEGGTTVEVRVTAPSGAVRTWTAVVERRGDRDAGLAEAAFSVGLPGVGSGAFHVTPVADDVDRYTARLVPSSPGATVSARLDGRELAPGPDGSVLVPVHRGATVLEVRVTAGDGATTRVHRWVTLSERAAAPFVAVDAQSRCLAGRAHVAVRADNHGTSPLDVTLTTDLGSRAVTGLTPGRSAYQSFPARAARTDGGVAGVEVAVDGERHLVTAAYPALDC
ncbi:hypothetical protein GJV82_07260 [Cellulosimicrobium sp. BIT-GX5]|uniref:Uncharacterized protein n=1 Tax=Cellulosimicrobium composti TaxID=2672572 RepID=A0A6N7ZH43_9MICO|nr:hypothetical protein [Cellulosimicrobium composti]MTG88741.1 hypothetical protein [Cellulosimicrobium composti]